MKKTYDRNDWLVCVIGISMSGLRLRDLHLGGGNYFRLILAVFFQEFRIFSYIQGHYFLGLFRFHGHKMKEREKVSQYLQCHHKPQLR